MGTVIAIAFVACTRYLDLKLDRSTFLDLISCYAAFLRGDVFLFNQANMKFRIW